MPFITVTPQRPLRPGVVNVVHPELGVRLAVSARDNTSPQDLGGAVRDCMDLVRDMTGENPLKYEYMVRFEL